MIPYGRQSIGEEEIAEVLRVLRSDFLTQGPAVENFEKAVADYCGVRHAIAVSSGTAALHAVYAAVGVGPGDEIVTSPITFAATGNAALYLGAKPVFADVDSDSALLSPRAAASKIGAKTKAIVPVDFAGRPADYDSLRVLANSTGAALIADAAHSLGASSGNRNVGQLADASIFSFHPVKTVTTCEGGMVVTDRADIADAVRRFRHHGIVRSPEISRTHGDWMYELQALGNNYRLSDLHAAVGIAQMRKIDGFISRRREIASRYDAAFGKLAGLKSPPRESGSKSAYHLYVLRLEDALAPSRRQIFEELRAQGIGVHVHYLPVYRHPYYQGLGFPQEDCPEAERFYAGALSLPIYPSLSDGDVDRVIQSVQEVVSRHNEKSHRKAEACRSKSMTPD